MPTTQRRSWRDNGLTVAVVFFSGLPIILGAQALGVPSLWSVVLGVAVGVSIAKVVERRRGI